MNPPATIDPRHQQYRDQATPLWPGDPPGGADGAEYWNADQAKLTGVQQPSLTWFPAPDAAANATVVVCPGGAFRMLSMDREGYAVAEALNLLGLHAVVLAYRHAGHGVDDPLPPRVARGVADLRRAVATVRTLGHNHRVDGEHVAVLGFSAGGLLALLGAGGWEHQADPSGDRIAEGADAPDSLGLIYPAPRSVLGATEPRLEAQLPPTFLATVRGDREGFRLADLAPDLWRREVACEVHEFAAGDHGHGLGEELPSTRHWPELYADWLVARCR